MSTIERTQQGTLDFFNRRIDDWTANAEQLQLSVDDLATLSSLLSAAQTNFDDAKEALDDAKAKVDLQDQAIDQLYAFGSLLVQQIRVAAKKEGTDTLYAVAKIDPPKKPTSRTDAPVPTNLTLRNTTNGNLVLSFEASKGQGSVFVIQRQYKAVGGQPTQYEYMDTTTEKTWTDTSVPNGLEWIGYQVATKLTNGVVSDWSDRKDFNFGGVGNQAPTTQAQASAEGGEPDGGETLTIEQAQALKDAQTAKGAEKAG